MASNRKNTNLNNIKMQAANEVGVPLKDNGYNGDLTSRQAGSVGGQMVKNMPNEHCPISVTPAGRTTCTRFGQCWNAPSPIVFSVFGRVTPDTSPYANALSAMLVTVLPPSDVGKVTFPVSACARPL